MVEQIYSSVRWRESLINMASQKIIDYIEIGPGKVLSGMVKRTLKDINCFSINSIDDIKNHMINLKDKKLLSLGLLEASDIVFKKIS